MRIYKQASAQVINQSAFDYFLNANDFITWKSDNPDNTFKKFKEEKGWTVYRAQRWGTIGDNRIPDYIVKMFVFEHPSLPARYRIELTSIKLEPIAKWEDGNENVDVVYNGNFSNVVQSIGIKNFVLPNEKNIVKRLVEGYSKSVIDGETVYNYIRLTKPHTDYNHAQSLEIWIKISQPPRKSIFSPKDEGEITPSSLFVVYFRNCDLETNFVDKPKRVSEEGKESPREAEKTYSDLVSRAKNSGYVDSSSHFYVPADATKENWDFRLNIAKTPKASPSDLLGFEDIVAEDDFIEPESKGIMNKEAQSNFGGYYSGELPDPTPYVGSSAVEAGQIKSAFGGADKAIKLVNEFNPDLLRNVAFIFNFAKAGAYGVYLSELDRAIKTQVLKKQLEQRGYKITDENGMLTAYPSEGEVPQEKVQEDIDRLYGQLNSGGGTAIGINMGNVLSAARSDTNAIGGTEQDYLFQELAVLHLGETIVHEAIHAKGSMSEGPSQQGEAAFANWLLPRLNKEYMEHLKSVGKENEFNEIVIGTSVRHAGAYNWYKMAQYAPIGSDLSGRHGGQFGAQLSGRQDWAMMFNQHSKESIEKQLGRQYMWPLAKDIDPDKDSIEEQLRKTFVHNKDTSKSTEELLQKDRAAESELYKPLETKLDDNRPHPLLQTLKKDASMTKIATLFGWYNNLSISDGSTIPGLGDRVMAWDDRDEDFAWTEEEIRKQTRYNPEYDEKGMYYRWIEPRFAPQLYDDMTRDLVNTHPAKRFGSSEMDNGMKEVLKIISIAKDKINSGKIKACRFIVSQDLMEHLSDMLRDVKTSLFDIENTPEAATALWISPMDIDDESLEKAEGYFRGEDGNEEIARQLLGITSSERVLDSVIEKLKEINASEGLGEIYLVGEPAREKISGQKISEGTFRFCCHNKMEAATYGQLLSKITGEDYDYDRNGDLKLHINDVAIIFHSGESSDVCNKLIEMGANQEDMSDGVKCELSNKDFTINMVALNLVDNSIYDPYGAQEDINNKVLRTRYPPETVVQNNPTVILKAMKLAKEGYEPNQSLATAITNGVPLLKNLDESVLGVARMFVLKNRIIGIGE